MPIAHNGNQEVYFEVHGDGPPVVLLHSFLFDRWMWKHQVPVISERFRVINVDLRGHGESGSVDEHFTLYDAVGDVIAVLDHLDIERAAWCGLSLGGMVALRAALAFPDRVARLALLDTDGGPETLCRQFGYTSLGWCAQYVGVTPLLPVMTGLMFSWRAHLRRIPDVRNFRHDVRFVPPSTIQHVADAIVGRDSLLSALGDIDVPALVLVGETDHALPVRCSERLHAGLSDSRLEHIPKAGHVCVLEKPDIVNTHLMDFLTDGEPW